jgi:hypothetical protein
MYSYRDSVFEELMRRYNIRRPNPDRERKVSKCIYDALKHFNLNSTEEAKYLSYLKKVEIYNWLVSRFSEVE